MSIDSQLKSNGDDGNKKQSVIIDIFKVASAYAVATPMFMYLGSKVTGEDLSLAEYGMAELATVFVLAPLVGYVNNRIKNHNPEIESESQ